MGLSKKFHSEERSDEESGAGSLHRSLDLPNIPSIRILGAESTDMRQPHNELSYFIFRGSHGGPGASGQAAAPSGQARRSATATPTAHVILGCPQPSAAVPEQIVPINNPAITPVKLLQPRASLGGSPPDCDEEGT